jgi:hypothetical protein
VPCSNRHLTYPLWLQNKRAWNVRWCAMFKQTCHLPAVITKQKSIECQKVMCHVQKDMSLTDCDYKTKEHGMSESHVPCSNRHVTYPLWLQNKIAWNVRKSCAMFKQTCHLPAVITKQKCMECQKVMCNVQADTPLTRCDYKTKVHGMSESNVPCSNRHVTYILWLQNKRAWNVRKSCAMFKQTCHLPAVITKQKSMECQKVMCHVQTDMSLTCCDYKKKEHGMSESDVPCSNRHVTYILWLQNKRAWNVRKSCAMFKQTCHLRSVITKKKSMECQKVMCHVQTDMSLTSCDNTTTVNRVWEYTNTAVLWNNKLTICYGD